MAEKCCYTCLNYDAGICQASDLHDDEDLNTFTCDLYDEDEEETRLFN